MDLRFLTALPVYNEAAHIAETLDAVRQYTNEILVVDDGSSDDTPTLLREQPGIQVVTHPVNQGYGAALRTAFEYTLQHNYDGLVTIDCDGQHEPKLIPELVKMWETDADLDIVSGSRYLKQFDGDSIPPEDRRRINLTITEQLNECLSLNLTDSFCGFKAYRAEALQVFDVTELGYAMPLQHWVQAVAAKLRIVEFAVPLVYLEEERSFGGSLDDARKRLAYYKEVLIRELEKHQMFDACSCLDA